MIGYLPKVLNVNGKFLPIRTDFRVVLNLFPMFDDPELSNAEKAYVTVKRLYECDITPEDFAEAVKQAYWYIDGGEMPKSEPEKARIIDWQKDERMIMPAVSKTIGVPDIRALPYLHWWTFLGCFGEVGDGLMTTVLTLRRKQAEGKLTKEERDFIRKHEDMICLRTPDEEAELQELKDVLDKLT